MSSVAKSLLLVVACGVPLFAPTATLGAQAAAAKPSSGKSNGKGKPVSKQKAKGKPNGKAAKKTRGKKPVAKKKALVERHALAAKGSPPNLQSRGALVVDMENGQEIFARKPDQPRAIASISKLAATLVVMDHNLDLDGLTTIRKVDAEVARGGAPSRLLEGMTLSNRDLLHAALLGSDNRAVSALGRAVGLSTTQLTNAMNRRVAALELRGTRFREPTGLSPENLSTPRELLQLLRAVMSHPVLGPIVRRQEYDAHPVGRPPIKYVSTVRPAARPSLQILGGKTGFNDAARYCLVIAIRIDGHSYSMALLGTEGKLTRFGDVARVVDWIVSHKTKLTKLATVQGPPLPAGSSSIPDASTSWPTHQDIDASADASPRPDQ